MSKPIITKEKFNDYRTCQQLGYYNMFCYNQYKHDGLTKLTKDEWLEIITNYSTYTERFK